MYAPLLKRQIEIIQPRVIATLGRFAMTFVIDFLHVELPIELDGEPHVEVKQTPTISELHGKTLHGKAGYGAVAVVPLFHPAVALYSAQRKGTLFSDFALLRAYI